MDFKIKDLVKKEDPIYGHYVAQPLGALFVKAVYKTKISPNLVTIISLLLALGAGVLFIYHYYIIGVILLNLALILDCADGQLAKVKNLKSELGAYLDYYFDRIKDVALIFSLSLGDYLFFRDYRVLIIGFLGIAFFFLRKFNTYDRDIYSLKKFQKTAESNDLIKDDNTSQFKKSLKHTLFFKEADRVLFFSVFALINQLYWGLLIYLFIQILLTAASSYINFKKFKHE
jgi:hypothetical protein